MEEEEERVLCVRRKSRDWWCSGRCIGSFYTAGQCTRQAERASERNRRWREVVGREKEKKKKKKLLFQLLLSVRRYNSSWWSVARVEEYSIERWAAENVLAHARQHPSRAVAHRHFLSGITRDVDICFLPMYRTQVESGFAVFCCYCHPLDSIGGIDNFYTKCWLCTMHREVSLFLSPDESDVIRHSPMRRPTWPPLASVYSSR